MIETLIIFGLSITSIVLFILASWHKGRANSFERTRNESLKKSEALSKKFANLSDTYKDTVRELENVKLKRNEVQMALQMELEFSAKLKEDYDRLLSQCNDITASYESIKTLLANSAAKVSKPIISVITKKPASP